LLIAHRSLIAAAGLCSRRAARRAGGTPQPEEGAAGAVSCERAVLRSRGRRSRPSGGLGAQGPAECSGRRGGRRQQQQQQEQQQQQQQQQQVAAGRRE
jgi:hypothetical protein